MIKGGSHLCADTYCLRYRPAARRPQMIDTGMSHIGFRTVDRAPAPPREESRILWQTDMRCRRGPRTARERRCWTSSTPRDVLPVANASPCSTTTERCGARGRTTVQLEFFVDALPPSVADDPSVGDTPEFAALLAGDHAAHGGARPRTDRVRPAGLFAGIAPEEFTSERPRRSWHSGATRRWAVSSATLRYQPMLELIDELRSHEFTSSSSPVAAPSSSARSARTLYGVPPEAVVGTLVEYEFTRDADGRPGSLRTDRTVRRGQRRRRRRSPTSRRNSAADRSSRPATRAGDAEMLEYALAAGPPSMALVVSHDDAEREYAYEGRAGSFETDGSFDDTARGLGITVVSMRSDWVTVF